MALILDKVTPELAMLIEAARDFWWTDRRPTDQGERLLSAALARAFPEEINTRQNCTCGAPCDECMDQAFVDSEIAHLESVMASRHPTAEAVP